MKKLLLIGYLLLSVSALGAIKFSAAGDFARLRSGVAPDFQSNWTFCTWIKTTAVNPGTQFNLMDHENFFGTAIQFNFYITTSGKVNFWNGSADIFTGTANIADGKWHTYCGTRDSANHWASYVDGALDASTTNAFTQAHSASLGTGNDEGANEGTNFTCECSYAESVWYQTVLTLDQIKAYAKGVPPSQIDALHYSGVSAGIYWAEYFDPTSIGAVADGSGGRWNGFEAFGHGSYATDGHCPCNPPAGAESH